MMSLEATSCAILTKPLNAEVAFAALRDTLLPKLVSGELRLPDAERIVGSCL